MSVLVVDDEPDLEALILQRFRHQIRDGSLAFHFAADGVEALEAIATHPEIGVVLADLNMPRMDGLTLLQHLQDVKVPLATVVVSAYGDMANIRMAMNRGAFDFLTKPIDFADLEATVAKSLRHVVGAQEALVRRAAAERAHAALARYFSPNLAAELAAEGRARDLSGQRRDVTALFTDIAGFTRLVEIVEPATLLELLNAYFAGTTDIVFAHAGTVMRGTGDGLHLLFGAPGDQSDHAARAVACALALDAFCEEFRTARQREGIALGITRIGLHSGPALVGDFGGGRYFDYAAHGDTINTAARLESANKTLGTRICASAAVAERVGGFTGRPVGDLIVRGRSSPLRAFQLLSQDVSVAPATVAYEAAFGRLAVGDPEALPAFAALVSAHPGDPLANFHLRRLLNGEVGTRIDLP